jgi:Inner membrane component of T3SS, cytoplasmic domain
MAPPNGSGPSRRRPAPSAPGGPVRARRSAEAAPGAGGRLVCTAGPAQGEEFALTGDELVIGRASDNPISIPDTSVSRKHVLIRKTPEGWAASDMGSGNGTMVNGETIAQETPLKAGDAITIGDTELKFEDGAAAAGGARRPAARKPGDGGPPPVNTSNRTRAVVRTSRRGAGEVADLKAQRRKLLLRVVAAAFVVVGGGVAFKVVKDKQAQKKQFDDLSERERQEALKAEKQAITNLVREGKWREAKEKLATLRENAPDYEPQQLEQLATAAEREIPNQERLTEAGDLIAKGEIAAAGRALNQVSAETTQYKQRDKLRADLGEKIRQKINDARPLLATPKDIPRMRELLAIADDILVAQPDNRDAMAFKAVAEEGIKPPPPPPPPPPGKPWVEVQRRFATGDATGAFSLAEACAAKDATCKKLKGQIMEYGDLLKKAENASPNQLVAMIELDLKICGEAGGPSPPSRTYQKKASDALCLKASGFKTVGNLVSALDAAKKARSVDPSSLCANAMITEGKGAAKQRFMEGYTNGDQDEQIKAFKDVIAMTPPDDEWHQKAKRKLEELAGGK